MIEKFESLDSTNAYCQRNAEDLGDCTLVVALSQSAGRGRQGRSWVSPSGLNFYGSLILKPPYKGTRMEHLPQIAGLAVYDTLPQFGVDTAWIKWPNDVYIGNKKVCGILSECCLDQGKEALIIGIGVNVNMPVDILNSIDRPATSILAETGVSSDLDAFTMALYEALLGRLEQARQAPDQLFQDWLDGIPLIGKTVEIVTATETVVGTAKSITPDGTLILDIDGEAREFVYGDVSLRI